MTDEGLSQPLTSEPISDPEQEMALIVRDWVARIGQKEPAQVPVDQASDGDAERGRRPTILESNPVRDIIEGVLKACILTQEADLLTQSSDPLDQVAAEGARAAAVKVWEQLYLRSSDVGNTEAFFAEIEQTKADIKQLIEHKVDLPKTEALLQDSLEPRRII